MALADSVHVDVFLEHGSLSDIISFELGFNKLTTILQLLIQQQRDHNSHMKEMQERLADLEKSKSEQDQWNASFQSKSLDMDQNLTNMNKSLEQLAKQLNEQQQSQKTNMRDQDWLIERLEKVETDAILNKDELENQIATIRSQVSFMLTNHASKAWAQEQDKYLRETIMNELSERDGKIQDINAKIDNTQQQMDQVKTNISRINDDIADVNKLIDQQQQKDAQLEETDSLLTKQIQDINGQIKEIEWKLKEKVNQEIFDKEFSYLKSLLTHLRKYVLTDLITHSYSKQQDEERFQGEASNDKNGKRNFDQKEIRDFEEKLRIMQEKIEELTDAYIKIPRIEDHLVKLNLRIKQFSLEGVEELLQIIEAKKCDKSSIFDFESRVSHLESAIRLIGAGNLTPLDFTNGTAVDSNLANQVEDLYKKLEELQNEVRRLVSRGTTAYVNLSEPESWREQLTNLRKEMDQLKQSLTKKNGELEKSLKFKADVSNLSQIENLLMEQLNSLNGKLEDLAKMKTQIRKLETVLKKIQSLMADVPSKLETSRSPIREEPYHEEDAMFSKKPLGGYSCASCDKDLFNLHGTQAHYHPWSKLPFRDPTERISKVGQGFSRMLQQIKPEYVDRLRSLQQQQQQQQQQLRMTGEDTLADQTFAENEKQVQGQLPKRQIIKSQLSKTQSNFGAYKEGSVTERISMQTPQLSKKKSSIRAHIMSDEKLLSSTQLLDQVDAADEFEVLNHPQPKLPQITSKTPRKP